MIFFPYTIDKSQDLVIMLFQETQALKNSGFAVFSLSSLYLVIPIVGSFLD